MSEEYTGCGKISQFNSNISLVATVTSSGREAGCVNSWLFEGFFFRIWFKRYNVDCSNLLWLSALVIIA